MTDTKQANQLARALGATILFAISALVIYLVAVNVLTSAIGAGRTSDAAVGVALALSTMLGAVFAGRLALSPIILPAAIILAILMLFTLVVWVGEV